LQGKATPSFPGKFFTDASAFHRASLPLYMKAMREPYPFAPQGLCLAPAALLLCGISFALGSEEAVRAYFTAVREANPLWTGPVAVFSDGAPFLFYPVYAFFLLRGVKKRNPEDIFFAVSYVLAQLLIACLLCRVVKIAVGRPRPMTGGPFHPFSLGWGYQSFPSGHTGEVVGSASPLVRRYGRSAPPLVPLGFGLLIAAVAFSRVYLGMHHPTDIWGGLVLGSLRGYASWALRTAFMARRRAAANARGSVTDTRSSKEFRP
jgi:undecaprenyl-diphosphatase